MTASVASTKTWAPLLNWAALNVTAISTVLLVGSAPPDDSIEGFVGVGRSMGHAALKQVSLGQTLEDRKQNLRCVFGDWQIIASFLPFLHHDRVCHFSTRGCPLRLRCSVCFEHL